MKRTHPRRRNKRKRRPNPAADVNKLPTLNLELMGHGLALVGLGLFVAGLFGVKPPQDPQKRKRGQFRLIKGGKDEDSAV